MNRAGEQDEQELKKLNTRHKPKFFYPFTLQLEGNHLRYFKL